MKTLTALLASTCILSAQVTNQLNVVEIIMPCPWPGCKGQMVQFQTRDTNSSSIRINFGPTSTVIGMDIPPLFFNVCTSNRLKHTAWYTNEFPRFETNQAPPIGEMKLTVRSLFDLPDEAEGKWTWMSTNYVIPNAGTAGGYYVKEKQ